MNKFTKKLAATALIGMTMAGGFGCAYGGIASTPDGTVVVTRNDLLLFGLLRKVFVCKQAGASMTCTEVAAPP